MSIPDKLRSAYHRTTFQAETPGGTVAIRCGREHAELDKLLSHHRTRIWAYITACNPRSETLPDAVNAERQSALIRLLEPRFPLYHGHGVSDDGGWAPEPSVLVIGISRDEAATVGRNFRQYAVVAGERGKPAELIDCWGLWPVSVEPGATAAEDAGDEMDEGTCRCPACGAAYDTAGQSPCPHLITDWCFTAEVEPGEPRGFWATESEGKLLADFERAVSELEELLSQDGWPGAPSRKAVLALLPAHLRARRSGTIPWSDLLGQRIAAAPGYLGKRTVRTDSMAGDEWDVHWAENGSEAASFVEAQFWDDLTTAQAVIARARAVLDRTD